MFVRDDNQTLVTDTDSREMSPEPVAASILLKILSILFFVFGLFAFVGSLFLWGEGFILQPPDGVNIALPVADMFINAPASLLAAVGLWRLRRYGYLASYFVAGIYLYASAFILVDVFLEQPPEFWVIVLPQVMAVLVALTLLLYLPRIRTLFQ